MFFMILLNSVCTEAAMALSRVTVRGSLSKGTAPAEDRAYFRLIDDALKYKANRKIKNTKPAHTVYILNKFFSCARREVRIYTGRLSRSIGALRAYADPDIVGSAIEFLRREDSRLSIVILGEPDVEPGQPIGSHPLLVAISQADGIRGSVRVARGDPSEWKEFPYHFMIMDSEAVRIEFDGNCTDAAARFGDAHFTARLVRVFDELERSGTPLFRTEAANGPSRNPSGLPRSRSTGQ
ncbi:MAG: hypothetical protein OXQ29_07490 [Rhodospirillaceae bacterium]|nr:hypothetical protein [Rhodospirillaceae bacterium]